MREKPLRATAAFPSSMREFVTPHVMHLMPSSFVNNFFAGSVSVQKNQNVSHWESADKRTIQFSLCFYYLPVIILRKRLCCFNGKNATSSRLLCLLSVITAFYHCTRKPTKCLKGGVFRPVLAFYGIASCLNAEVVLVSACVRT